MPVTPQEQVESTHEAYWAGASLVHIHVRNADEIPSFDPGPFAQVQDLPALGTRCLTRRKEAVSEAAYRCRGVSLS